MGFPFLQRSEPSPSDTGSPSSEEWRLLVVDDSELVLELIDVALTERGARIERALSAPEAREMIGERPPDLVLTDLQMPGGSGIELLEWLARHYPDIPGLLMTASPEAAPPDWTPRLIEKPFCFEKLWAMILGAVDGTPPSRGGR